MENPQLRHRIKSRFKKTRMKFVSKQQQKVKPEKNIEEIFVSQNGIIKQAEMEHKQTKCRFPPASYSHAPMHTLLGSSLEQLWVSRKLQQSCLKGEG